MDRFHAAVDSVIPQLRELQDGLRPAPRASRLALRQLKQVATRAAQSPAHDPAPSLLEAAAAPPPANDTSPAIIDGRAWTLPELAAAARHCTACPHLAESRTQVVFGSGNPAADLMFVGDHPGTEEDAEGIPFVGPAGELLARIIQTMGLSRDDVYLANALKCRPNMPPGTAETRQARPAELTTCHPWLAEQIRLIRPSVIVALGETALLSLLNESRPITELRGQWLSCQNIPLMPTFHPSYLLRNSSQTERRKLWEDLLLVMEKLNLPISPKQRRYFSKP